MTKKIQVNITTAVNVAAVRKEKRNGRDVLVVPSATLPDNVVMNGIKYPAEEIAKSFMTLNRKPAPFGHPKVNGKFVSASDPEGINSSYIGAWNENVRREGGRVLLDKIIDVAVANQTEHGKSVIAAIEAGGPVHTSTGLFCELDEVNGERSARNMYFDHDAILLNEDGAATPDQGVGMLVNASGDAEEIEVVNSFYDEADRSLDWAVESVVRAVESQRKAGIMERIKAAITDAVTGITRETQTMNEKEIDMEKKDFEALSATVNSLAESVKALADGMPAAIDAAIKPLTEAQAALAANQKAAEETERLGFVNSIVKAGLMTEAEAGELTLNAARVLAAKTAPKTAAPLAAGAFMGNAGDEAWYNPNEIGKAN
jgi:flagellin-like hook-associated protein FlgL